MVCFLPTNEHEAAMRSALIALVIGLAPHAHKAALKNRRLGPCQARQDVASTVRPLCVATAAANRVGWLLRLLSKQESHHSRRGMVAFACPLCVSCIQDGGAWE